MSIINKRKYNYQIIKKLFENENYVLLSTEYISYSSHLDYICSNGHTSSITLKNFIKGRRCSICANRKRYEKHRHEKYKEVYDYFSEQGCELLSKEYIDIKTKLDYICLCGTRYATSFTKFKIGQRCSNCTRLKAIDRATVYDFAAVKHIFEKNGCVLLSEKYTGGRSKLDYICVCGRHSKISFYSFLRGARCRKCFAERNSGANNPNWNPMITDEEREIKRGYLEYFEWRHSIFLKDNFTCQICKDDTGGNLNAHHINSYDWCREGRLDIKNGITLCDHCHAIDISSFHKIFGFGKNTYAQFEEWIGIKKSDVKIDIAHFELNYDFESLLSR